MNTPPPAAPESSLSPLRLALKTLLLLVIFNLVFALLQPLPLLGRISAYNLLFPGRPRLPFGEQPELAYNLSLFNLPAMLASHEIGAGTNPESEYRVILLGDSSVWGFLLRPEETLAGQLNRSDLQTSSGRTVRVYNLGYPTITLTKDLLMLNQVQEFDPDLIVWLITLEAMPRDGQLDSPIVQQNPAPVKKLIRQFDLNLDLGDTAFVEPNFWERTLVGQRRNLADLVRLQLFGALWAATGIDQHYPAAYERRAEDFEADPSFHSLQEPLDSDELSLEILQAGLDLAGRAPVLLVNQPIFIANGSNSHIRYNFYYPRWAYDQYRQMMAQISAENNWSYLDFWDAVPASEFTNTALHLTPAGSKQLADLLAPAILDLAQNGP